MREEITGGLVTCKIVLCCVPSTLSKKENVENRN